MKYIIDTSAILSGKISTIHDNFYTVPLVVKELKSKKKEYVSEKIKVHQPSERYIKDIEEIAKNTGDIERLSSADIEVLALAKELDGIILTDDYSIQNLALEIGVKYLPIFEKGILKKIYWKYVCEGCRKEFHKKYKECPVCGKTLKYAVKNATLIK